MRRSSTRHTAFSRSAFGTSNTVNTERGTSTTPHTASMRPAFARVSSRFSPHEDRPTARLLHLAGRCAGDRPPSGGDRTDGRGGRVPLAVGDGPLLPDPAVGQA